MKKTRIIAHAGCEQTIPGSEENLRVARDCGADIVEMDLRVFGGEVYLSHDPVDGSNCDRLLTLGQAFTLLESARVRFNCDLKTAETMQAVVRIAASRKLLDRVIFTGEYTPERRDRAGYRHFRNVEHLGIVEPHEPISRAKAERLVEAFRRNADRTLEAYNVEYTTLTDEALSIFEEAGIPLCCWTVDDLASIRRLFDRGIYAVTTNLLQEARAAREAT